MRTDGYCPPGFDVVGGWAEVHKDGWKFPLSLEVGYAEYVGRKKDGSITKMWQEKKATMIRKVALVQALREAFPSSFGGMYAQEEMSHLESDKLSDQPVTFDVPPTRAKTPPRMANELPIVEPKQVSIPPDGCKHEASGEVAKVDCEKEDCFSGCPAWTRQPGEDDA